jgi:hypothetical protein
MSFRERIAKPSPERLTEVKRQALEAGQPDLHNAN